MIADGLYRFDKFYYERIYGPRGYYQNGNGAGYEFETVSTSDSSLPKKISEALDKYWSIKGKPKVVNFYEVGSGDGTFIKKLLEQNFGAKKYLTIYGIDVLSMYKACYPENVSFCSSLPPGQLDGFLFCNEVLDQQPFRFLRRAGNDFEELLLNISGGLVKPIWQTVQEDLPECIVNLAHGDFVFPLQQEAASLVKSITSRFSGIAIFCDYGFRTTENFRGQKWLRCMSNGTEPSIKNIDIAFDISSCVAFDQIIDGDKRFHLLPYRQWLGADTIFDEGFWTLVWTSEDLQNHFG